MTVDPDKVMRAVLFCVFFAVAGAFVVSLGELAAALGR